MPSLVILRINKAFKVAVTSLKCEASMDVAAHPVAAAAATAAAAAVDRS